MTESKMFLSEINRLMGLTPLHEKIEACHHSYVTIFRNSSPQSNLGVYLLGEIERLGSIVLALAMELINP